MDTFEALTFFRGVSARYNTQHPTIHEIRRNRRPKDTSIEFHSIVDGWFHSRFGVPYRSQALFLTSQKLTAQAHAETPDHVMRIMPLSAYRYCWSPNTSDLLFLEKRLSGAGKSEIEAHLESLGYRECDLKEAHLSGNEVMLHCEKYITIPTHLIATHCEKTSGVILLK